MSDLYVLAGYVATNYDGGTPAPLGELCYAAEITVWDIAAQTASVQYVSSAPFVTGPNDTPPHTAFDPCIQQPALMRQMIFDASRSFGASQISYGEMTLANVDGHLDDWGELIMEGRALVLRVGRSGLRYPDDWALAVTALMDPPYWDERLLSLRLRSKMTLLDRELPLTRYAGNNVLPNGLEGTAGDLAGRYKPRSYGLPNNVSLLPVNTSKLIYQFNDGPINVAIVLLDNGVELAFYGDYSMAVLQASAPSPGSFMSCCAEGYIRLGSPASGVLSITLIVSSEENSAASIFQQVALAAGIDSSDIVTADLTALKAVNGSSHGLWIGAPITARDALDMVAQSVGACYWFDVSGQLRIAAITPPRGTPVMILTVDTILSLKRQAASIPARQIEVRYAKNWTVLTQFAGGVTESLRAWLAQEWRIALADGVSVADYPSADVWSIDTLLSSAYPGADNQDAAESQAAAFALLFGVKRDRLTVNVRIDAALIGALELNAVIRVVYPRFGYDDGKLMRVMGIETDLRIGRAELTLWG